MQDEDHISQEDYPRPTHPEHILHNIFIQNINQLKQNIQHSKADLNDMLYNFFSQFIHATLGEFNEPFKNMVSDAVYNDSHNMECRRAAAYIIKKYDIGWPDKFISSTTPRIYLSDIRNQIVFEFWSTFQYMIEAQWMPETNTNGNELQNKMYKKIAHQIGGRLIDPKDSERLYTLLTWMHYLKLIHYTKKNLNNLNTEKNIHILNTCSGSWLYIYNKHGMKKLIWELFLDIWYYDNEG